VCVVSDELPEFLLYCADHESDRNKRTTLRVLVSQWRQPAEFVKSEDVWDAMVYASHAYKDVPGYREHWTP
jgi:hypothetical protein